MRQHFAQFADFGRTTGSLYERISVQEITSAVSSVTIEWAREYEEVIIYCSKLKVATDAVQLKARTKRRGQSSYDSGATDYTNNGHWFHNDGVTTETDSSSNAGHDHLRVAGVPTDAALGTGTREEANIELRLLNGLDGRRPELYTESVVKSHLSHILGQIQFSHGFANGGEHVGIDFFASTGDISSGRFYAIGRVPLRV